MTEEQLIDSFGEATLMHINDGLQRGLDPVHVANIQLLSAIRMMAELRGVEATRAGLILAAKQIGGDHG
jgi:hypothetical protein